ncbi:MAG: choice-of-anchor J domain-containing protein, partial [Salinivirgaceae bacterium]|nr:choice-of-anchor J domain-containing protein [Salinivirgaceae bacterium]
MIKKLLFIAAMAFTVSGYTQTVFEDNFNDSATWATWTLGDLDGDGEFWEFTDAVFQEIESFEGGFAWSFSWYFETFTPDNTLTSPSISLPRDASLDLSFKVAAYEDDELFQEHYAVYVIPVDSTFTGTEVPVFEETLDADYYNPPKTVNVDISSFVGQDVKLVFRHYDCTDIFYISLDDVKIDMTHLGAIDNAQQTIQVYPNPTSDIVAIQGVDDVNRIRVFNLEGKMMKEVNAA